MHLNWNHELKQVWIYSGEYQCNSQDTNFYCYLLNVIYILVLLFSVLIIRFLDDIFFIYDLKLQFFHQGIYQGLQQLQPEVIIQDLFFWRMKTSQIFINISKLFQSLSACNIAIIMYYYIYSPSIVRSRSFNLITLFVLLFMALLNNKVNCQFQLMQLITNPDEQSQNFDASNDFKYIALHSNTHNTLYIYECMRPLFNQYLVFQQKQQIVLDAQIYTILKISTEHSKIYLGSISTSTVHIYTINPSNNLFYLQKTLKLTEQKYLSVIADHPIKSNIVAIGLLGSTILIDTLSAQLNVVQKLQVQQNIVKALSFSHNGQFLSTGGTTLRIDIYKFNNDSQSYQELNTFPQGQDVKKLRFSSIIQFPEYPYTLIVTLLTKIKIYVYNEGIGHFIEYKTINNHNGAINDKMTVIVENSAAEDMNIATIFKEDNETHQYDRRQQLQVVLMRIAKFDETLSNLIILGSNFIRTYRFCDVDYCQRCEIVQDISQQSKSMKSNASSVRNINYNCIQCFVGYQQKQGVECIRCIQYPNLCRNCISANKCNKCIDGYTVNSENFCVACHIDDCEHCQSTEICQKCQKQYDLDSDQNFCYPKDHRINLVGIIIGTIVGAVIVIVVAIYILFRKAMNKKKFAQSNKSISFRRNRSKVNARKQSLLNTRQEIKSVYQEYVGSSDSESNND